MATLKKRKNKSAPLPRSYSGQLDCMNGEGEIEVTRFIVSGDSISFDLVIDGGLGENWRFCSSAKLDPDSTFVSENVEGTQILGIKAAGPKSVRTQFCFEIIRQSDLSIRVAGMIYFPDFTYSFEGTLKKFKQKTQR